LNARGKSGPEVREEDIATPQIRTIETSTPRQHTDGCDGLASSPQTLPHSSEAVILSTLAHSSAVAGPSRHRDVLANTTQEGIPTIDIVQDIVAG
jgi:hypothetical protein